MKGLVKGCPLVVEWILGKIKILGLKNHTKIHIPLESLELVDIKTAQDHLLAQSWTHTANAESGKYHGAAGQRANKRGKSAGG